MAIGTLVTRFDSSDRALAIGLVALAGFVDAIGFLVTGGYFVSFMSADTTRLGVGLAAASNEAGIAARLVVMFVGGVTLGMLVGRRAGTGTSRRAIILAIAGVLIAVATMALRSEQSGPGIALLAMAMGVQAAAFGSADAYPGPTGGLVRIGEALATAIGGGAGWGWVTPLFLWGAMMAGAWIGALAFFRFGQMALLGASLGAFLFAGASLLAGGRARGRP